MLQAPPRRRPLRGRYRPPLIEAAELRGKMAYWLAWLAHHAHDAVIITTHAGSAHLHYLHPLTGEFAPEHGRPGTTRNEIQKILWDAAAKRYAKLGADPRIEILERCRILEDVHQMGRHTYATSQELDGNIRHHVKQSTRQFPGVWEGIPVWTHQDISQLKKLLAEPLNTYEEALAITAGRLEVMRRRAADTPQRI